MNLLGIILYCLCLLVCLTCFCLVAEYHYRRGERLLGVLLVVLAPLGFFFAYVYGWLCWRDRYMRLVMVVWTVSLLLLGQLLQKPGVKLGG
jgi:hypothetical protein